jgi:glycosyltransferase involved in cell wall biosynthesis
MFSPVPPMPSGIAAYVADLLPLLPTAWRVDVFTDEGVEEGSSDKPIPLRRADGASVPCYPHTQFAARHRQEPYDLNVYQVGNTAARAYVYDYVTSHPGLLVLHDGVVHPARVGAAIAAGDIADYRRVAVACREDVGEAIGHLVAGGLGGPSLYRTFPMCEDLVRASRATAMHGELACDWLRALVPAPVVSVPHWRSVVVDADRRDAWRKRLCGEGEVLIGSFGNIGPERRLDRVFAALAALSTTDAAAGTPWRLVIAGEVAPELGLESLAADLGIAERVSWQSGLDDDDFVAVMAATAFAVNLRYPPARSSSGVLHQLLQLGVPAVITDVLHWRDYPETTVKRVPPGPDADEHAALRDALGTWVGDADERAEASAAAAAWAAANLTPERMRAGYVDAVAAALRSGT